MSLVVSWFGDDLRCGRCTLRPAVEQDARGRRSDAVARVGAGAGRARRSSAASTVGRCSVGRRATPRSCRPSPAEGPWQVGDVLSFHPDGHSAGQRSDRTRGPAPTISRRCLGVAGSRSTRRRAGRDPPDKSAGGGGRGGRLSSERRGRPTSRPARTRSATTGRPNGPIGDSSCTMRISARSRAVSTRSASGRRCAALTQLRDGPHAYPAVRASAQAGGGRAVRSSGPQVRIGYAADWSEYFGHQPADGSGDVIFHLDPLWAHSGDRLHRHRQLHAAVRLARRPAARGCRRPGRSTISAI